MRDKDSSHDHLQYSAFYDKYANIAFTKNPEKYVRYTAAQGGGDLNAAVEIFTQPRANAFVHLFNPSLYSV